MLVSHKICDLVSGPYSVRVNLAWYSKETLRTALESTDRPVVLDLPINRSKPPWTDIDYTPEGIKPWVDEFHQIDFLAISNVNSIEDCKKYMDVFPDLKIVPKIESFDGVENLEEILSGSSIEVLMIDHDDLYTNANGHDVSELIDKVKCVCKRFGCEVMMASGVVFEFLDQEEVEPMAYLCAKVENASVDPAPAIEFAKSKGMSLWIPEKYVTVPKFPTGAYECKEAIDRCRAIICIPPIGRDCAWELGYAIASNKKVYVLGELDSDDWMTRISAEIIHDSI